MFKHILVPVAFGDDHNSDEQVAITRSLAGPDTKVTFLHVMEEVPGYISSYMPPEAQLDARDAVVAALNEIATGVANSSAEAIWGHSGRSILDWAGDNDVDLVIIASHRPGLSDYLLGSTAARVVRHAQCSVHVIR